MHRKKAAVQRPFCYRQIAAKLYMVRNGDGLCCNLGKHLLLWQHNNKQGLGRINATRGNVFDPDDILALMSGSYGLVLHELEDEPFLQRARDLTKANSVALVRWLENDPDTQLTTFVGEPLELPAGFKPWLDECLHRERELPVLLSELADEHSASDSLTNDFINNPRTMAVVLDTQPSRIVIVFRRNSSAQEWDDTEHDSYMAVARIMRQCVRLHKLVDSMKGVIEIAKGLFNSSQSGMIIMQPDGEINLANRVATRILKREDGISIRNNKLLIDDPKIHQDFKQLLVQSQTMSKVDTHGFQWHRGIKRQSSKTAYQLSVHMLSLAEWHMESRYFDKVIVVFLADPLGFAMPTADQLKSYYDFTDAQAKVALALWGGTGIREAAEHLAISINTARSHLRAIYEKVGVANHAELMAVLTTSLNRTSNLFGEGEFYEPNPKPPYRADF